MIVAIIQARVGSTRLPNKIFNILAGKPLIWHVVNRLKFSKRINKVVLATTNNTKDDVLAKWAIENNVILFRGSEDNVLERFYFAAKENNASVIVRITADDPFKDPEIIDEVIGLLEDHNLSFAYNNNPPSFPEGLDTEVFTFDALEAAYRNSKEKYELEHVTQHFYRNKNVYRQMNFPNSSGDFSYLRWTIDTQTDFEMARKVYKALYKEGQIFYRDQILQLLKDNPEIAAINSDVPRSLMYKKDKHGQI